MPEVLIDGVEYAPRSDRAEIVVAITTHNRQDVLAASLEHWHRHSPSWIQFVVVDDASSFPVPVPTWARSWRTGSTPLGIAQAKNKCLELAMEMGADHIFLADDDIWPATDQWWAPYVNSPEPHLMYLFEDPDGRGGHRAGSPATIYADAEHFALAKPRGCLLYAAREVVDRVGGMRPEFGRWGGEHEEWSNRIYSAGLTTFRFTDVAGSSKIWHSMDEHYREHQGFRRSVDDKTRGALVADNERLREQLDGTTDFVEFREQRDIVLTCLLTSRADPQRGKKWDPAPEVLDSLFASLSAEGIPGIAICDELESHPNGEVIPATSGTTVYAQRWIAYHRYLRAHPEVRWVWCVDGSDVTMARNPFPSMEVGVLYTGWEPCLIGDNKWMLDPKNHSRNVDWLKDHADRVLLNAGVVGGDRATMLDFTRAMVDLFAREQAEGGADPSDMARFNRAAYGFRLQSGPRVTNIFKSGMDNGTAWFLHK